MPKMDYFGSKSTLCLQLYAIPMLVAFVGDSVAFPLQQRYVLPQQPPGFQSQRLAVVNLV